MALYPGSLPITSPNGIWKSNCPVPIALEGHPKSWLSVELTRCYSSVRRMTVLMGLTVVLFTTNAISCLFILAVVPKLCASCCTRSRVLLWP